MSVAVRVIPCLDVKDGRVVKGVNFVGLRDAGDPVELAGRYDRQGADEITFLDVSASAEGRATMLDVVSATAEQVFVPLTVGGGVRNVEDVDLLLRAGADKVSINTAAIDRPGLLSEVAERFGSQVLVLSVDARRCPEGVSTPSGYEVTTHGGRRPGPGRGGHRAERPPARFPSRATPGSPGRTDRRRSSGTAATRPGTPPRGGARPGTGVRPTGEWP